MALSKFLDPKNDISFRRIFGTEKIRIFLFTFLMISLASLVKVQYRMYVCHLFSVNLLQDMEIVTLLTIRNTAT